MAKMMEIINLTVHALTLTASNWQQKRGENENSKKPKRIIIKS
jgi:hypothetical protein